MDDVSYSSVHPERWRHRDAYDGVLRFHFQDGTTGRRIKVGVTAEGSKVTLVMPGGSLATGAKTLTGTIGQDGSIYFKNCQTQLPYVTRKTAPEMCLFQDSPGDPWRARCGRFQENRPPQTTRHECGGARRRGDGTGLGPPVHRPTVRVLLLDAADRLLLLRTWTSPAPASGTQGGKRGSRGGRRPAHEETGLRDAVLGPVIVPPLGRLVVA
jgi:hypothetical protein